MINDWEFRKFAIISFSLLIMLNGSIAINAIGFKIPLLRPLIGFLFLTFIPGYTILRILKVHEIDKIASFLLAIGLSLFYIMIIGLFINIFYPFIGIKKPIKVLPLLSTFDLSYLLLLLLAYTIDRGYHKINRDKSKKRLANLFNLQILSFLSLPILAIIGAYFLNYLGDSYLIIVLFFIIASTPFFATLKKDERYLIWIIWIVSLSLLYISDFGSSWNYIWGNDINIEYYLSNTVLRDGFWNASFHSKANVMNVNAMLSIVALNPIYSIFLNLNSIMVFKIIYPFIFSLVPVGLYKIYSNILNKKESFLAAFFFISLLAFF